MRIISLHCDYIRFKPLKKAIKEREEISDKEEKEVKEPLVVLMAVEKGDNDGSVNELVDSVSKTAKEVGAKNIVLYPYAHLSSNLSSPSVALEILKKVHKMVEKKGFNVVHAPFGYYKEFELKCKGHPLSELSKEFVVSGAGSGGKVLGEEYDTERLLREISRTKLDTSKLKENDHRILGQKLDLFSFNEAAPGQPFWHEKGHIIFNELINFSRELQRKAGYQEILTPQIMNNKLWKVSGHWSHYQDKMFITEYEHHSCGVKPMSCPGAMLVYRSSPRSYKNLPLRFSEYGVVHRKELSGVLAGLFRVIRITQDDAHIFCTLEQLEQEMSGLFSIVKTIYKDTFGFDYHMTLSTRPEKFLGKKEDWDTAEAALERVLNKAKINYKVSPGEGAFYGPKIDLFIKDSMDREWQCATIQLDMQLPQRFEIKYNGADNKDYTPLVIHRAIFGSVERFIGVLLEHTNGVLPLWLSPIQVKIVNFTDRNTKAVENILEQLKKEISSLRIEADLRNTTVNDKIRDAELMKIPYTIVIGDKEEQAKTLAVRERGGKPKFGVKLDDFVKELKEKIKHRK